mmetsp:Transcript_20415/g.43783  ORF Transcript_20415/g.43783 Transcript_20415/m.43783 type:complete len:942 (+) Transcript_20415:195-3020(+)|eukprot:CAMPEP_0172543178 /NCGR_PEP_ID=MMETSP1067-20121228/13628_1 /TAXON_ID=265564 ORGANISM="Thalassiosira punctigera, Strain Tpunct2005C2" /NCGR_SAMPLE_ID=MMETSP1067 /ASSEMBLY_ACC=CAM_ASM_000444 /LENGTH=941 /DNA_ID=CAMNT_0013329543 /DNA_START=176 /DNA_END=3001 /DNA_ORIENTATION=+
MGDTKERRRRGKRNGLQGARANGKHSNTRNHHVKNVHQSSPQNQNKTAAPKVGYKPHGTLLVQFTEETPTWYDCGRNTVGRDDTISNAEKKSQKKQQHVGSKNTREIVSKYRELADEIYSHEISLSRESAGGGASYSEKDEKWVENTMKRGTLKDRVAAMSVVVGMDCMHKLYALDMLLDLAGCGLGGGAEMGAVPNSRVGQMASEALSDLFANTLLPKDRKLISLENRSLYLYEGDRTLSPRVLLLWRYEEMIKLRYASYLSRYLGRTLAGEDESSKKSALMTASALLMQIPEGEEVLLTMIVNKIGDPSRKIASAAGHQLRLILEEHPVMVNVVAREVQQLAHRPHLSPRALYNCVVFLNQLQLSRDEDEPSDADTTKNDKRIQKPTSLPASLINTYFHLFEMAVKKDESKKKGSTQSNSKDSSSATKSRLLGALLTGVNRAHPYLPKKDAAMEQHIDALYRISHTAPPAAATQALMLLFQLAVGSGEFEADSTIASKDESVTTRKDRFYRALYSKLVDGEMFAGRQLTLFFNLLYKAMKYDTSIERISAFSKRLLHTVLHQSSSIICGSLFLLSEIARCHPELQNKIESKGSEALFDPTKREPRAAFAGRVASSQNLWELSLLAHHFHPSVSKFTTGSAGEISYKGDPLKDFALAPFLDKFAFRNPKSMDKLSKQLKRGESIAERKSGLSGNTALPMNDPSYLEARNISEEEKFFHQFFLERAKRDEIKGIVRGSGANKGKDDSDLEDEALNAAEADEMIDDFEGDTDSEEEAFVNQLAEKLMESAGNGKVNLDGEDPDMDDWSDFDDDDEEDEDVKPDEEGDDNSADFRQEIGNEDSFMDAASSDDEEDDVFDAMEGEGGGNNGFGGETDVPFGLLGEDGSDDSEGQVPTKESRKQSKRKKPTSIYADAEEYENMLNEVEGEGGKISQKKKPKKEKR